MDESPRVTRVGPRRSGYITVYNTLILHFSSTPTTPADGGGIFLSPFYRRWTEIQREFLLPRDNHYGYLMPAFAQGGGHTRSLEGGPRLARPSFKGTLPAQEWAWEEGIQLSSGAFLADVNRGWGQSGPERRP